MIPALVERTRQALDQPVSVPVRAFAEQLGEDAGAAAVLFYGSNLRTGSLDGVLDFYVLTPGPVERGIWPTISYREATIGGAVLRAKIATLTLATFLRAADGHTLDTTIWTRFVQPAALIWSADEDGAVQTAAAVAAAAVTAAGYAAALGPVRGIADDYWRALFRATYAAELRVEALGREGQILEFGVDHFAGLLPLAWAAGDIDFADSRGTLAPSLPPARRRHLLARWHRRRRFGKPINILRLTKAAFTFDGAARYAAWKIERHTGIAVPLTPWRERHPILAAPGVLWRVWRRRRSG